MGIGGTHSTEEASFQAQNSDNEAYAKYQNQLSEGFQNLVHGHLVDACSSLFELLEWLLTKVKE